MKNFFFLANLLSRWEDADSKRDLARSTLAINLVNKYGCSVWSSCSLARRSLLLCKDFHCCNYGQRLTQVRIHFNKS